MAPFLAGHVRQPERGPRGRPGGQDRARGRPAKRSPTLLGAAPGRGRVHRRRHRGRQPRGEGRAPATPATPGWRDGVVTTGVRAQGGAGLVRPARGGGVPGRDGSPVPVDRASSTSTLGGGRGRRRTVLVSVMLVNNEVGTIQPLGEIVRSVRERAPGALRAHRRGAGGAVARRRRRPRRRPTWWRSRRTSSAVRRAPARSWCATA